MSMQVYSGELGDFTYDDTEWAIKTHKVNGLEYLNYIGNGEYCIKLPKGCINCRYLFYNLNHKRAKLDKIPYLDLSLMDTKDVVSMKGMFSDTDGLLKVRFGKFNTSNVTDMSEMFCNTSLRSIDVSSFITDKVMNMEQMFCRASHISSLNLEGFNTENVVSMKGMFSMMYSLRSLNLSSFSTKRLIDASRCFNGDFSLTSINMSSFTSESMETTLSVKDIFTYCKNLQEIIIGEERLKYLIFKSLMDYHEELKRAEYEQISALLKKCGVKESDLDNFNIGHSDKYSLNVSSSKTSKAVGQSKERVKSKPDCIEGVKYLLSIKEGGCSKYNIKEVKSILLSKGYTEEEINKSIVDYLSNQHLV